MPASQSQKAIKKKKKPKTLNIPDPVYQRWWSCCSWIADDLQAVQGPFPCQAWVQEGAGLAFAGTCWLPPLEPSLGEERSQLRPTRLAWISDKWHVQPQGTLVSSCLWTSFSFLSSAFELQRFSPWLSEIRNIARNNKCHLFLLENHPKYGLPEQ